MFPGNVVPQHRPFFHPPGLRRDPAGRTAPAKPEPEPESEPASAAAVLQQRRHHLGHVGDHGLWRGPRRQRQGGPARHAGAAPGHAGQRHAAEVVAALAAGQLPPGLGHRSGQPKRLSLMQPKENHDPCDRPCDTLPPNYYL